MKGKTRILAFSLLMVGIMGVAAVSADYYGRAFGGRSMRADGPHMDYAIEELGLSGDASKDEVMRALRAKRLSDLGLTDDSTIGEFHAAMRQRNMQMRAEKLSDLGLSDDADFEQVRQAVRQACVNDPDECPKKARAGRNGFVGRSMGCHKVF